MRPAGCRLQLGQRLTLTRAQLERLLELAGGDEVEIAGYTFDCVLKTSSDVLLSSGETVTSHGEVA